MGFAAKLLDRILIQELSQRYAYHCDMMEFDRLVDLFAPDAVFDETVIGNPLCQGHAQIRDFLSTAVPLNKSLFHLSGNYVIEVRSSDRASGRHYQYFEGIRISKPEMTRVIKGYFDEEFVKLDGTWKISSKKLGLLAPLQWRHNAEPQ